MGAVIPRLTPKLLVFHGFKLELVATKIQFGRFKLMLSSIPLVVTTIPLRIALVVGTVGL